MVATSSGDLDKYSNILVDEMEEEDVCVMLTGDEDV
jgi:hypothetical protein